MPILAMLTPIQQLPLTEAQRQTALNHNILALDLDCTAPPCSINRSAAAAFTSWTSTPSRGARP